VFFLHGNFIFIWIDKGKPGESRGRKAMGLNPSGEEGYDCQVTETLFAHLFTVGFSIFEALVSTVTKKGINDETTVFFYLNLICKRHHSDGWLASGIR
jgi:hypothetical protein